MDHSAFLFSFSIYILAAFSQLLAFPTTAEKEKEPVQGKKNKGTRRQSAYLLEKMISLVKERPEREVEAAFTSESFIPAIFLQPMARLIKKC